MLKNKWFKYGILAVILVACILLIVFGINNRSSEGEQEIEGGLRSEETDEGQENVIDFEEVFGDQETDGQTSEEGESDDETPDDDTLDGNTSDDKAQDGDTQDSGSQNGGTQGGNTQGGGTQGGNTQGGNTQGGGTQGNNGQDSEDSKWGPLF